VGRSSSRDARVRAAWAADRGYLLAVAAGMLGRPGDAEDVVQEAFTRLAGASVDDIGDVRGWLVVVTRRLCLDRLGSADARRTTPTPEPPEAGADSADPAARLALDDEVSRALAVVVERLSPGERTSFILHDIFGFPFDPAGAPVDPQRLVRHRRITSRFPGAAGSGPGGAVHRGLRGR
jgi:RNA polymerase sigma-70 factor (ECF subfamily)